MILLFKYKKFVTVNLFLLIKAVVVHICTVQWGIVSGVNKLNKSLWFLGNLNNFSMTSHVPFKEVTFDLMTDFNGRMP